MNRKQKTLQVLASIAVGGLIGAGLMQAGIARADTSDQHCQMVPWGFLGSQERIICDSSSRSPDGSWARARAVIVPAHWVPVTCYGSYFVTCSGGYPVSERTVSLDQYRVNDTNVLPDEPGYLG